MAGMRLSKLSKSILMAIVSWLFSEGVLADENGAQAIVNPLSETEQQNKRRVSNIDLLLDPVKKTGQLSEKVGAITIGAADKLTSLKRFTGVSITVTNQSDRVIEVNGEECTEGAGGTQRKCATIREISTEIDAPDSPQRKPLRDVAQTLTAAATVGAYPALRDQVIDSRSVRGRYGWDEKRRQQRITFFGKRVLYPGDTTSGIIYFPGSFKGTSSFSIPVSDFYDSTDKTSLSFQKVF